MQPAAEFELVVNALWDDEASVWVATSDDVPGLATESASFENSLEKLRAMVPELLELNDTMPKSGHARYRMVAERHESANGRILSRHTANAVMKQAGIAHKF